MPRIVELKWTCTECDTADILGRHKRCPTCGAPRESGEMDLDGIGEDDFGADGRNTGKTVTDASLLELAEAGEDWFCSACESGNRGDADTCASCGSPRQRARPREEPVVIPEEDDDALETAGFFASLFGVLAMGALALGGLVVCGGLLWYVNWLGQESEVTATVTRSHWSHEVLRETWTPVERTAFRDEISGTRPKAPVDGRGEVAGQVLVPGSCKDKHHHYEDYQCGTREVCEDIYRTETRRYDCSYDEDYDCGTTEQYECGETCTDLGNGFASCEPRMCTRHIPKTCSRHVSKTCTENKRVFDHKDCRDVPKMCQRSIEKPFCRYTTHTWQPSKREVAEGSGAPLRWPELEVGRLDRTRRTGTYEVVLGYEHRGSRKSHALTPTGESDFLRWVEPGSARMVVTNGGTVRSVTPSP